MEYETGLVAGQLPVAVASMPRVESVCIGVWFPAGSRYETASQSGMSHFVEHMLFKGTKQRNARQISQAVEGVGGYLNAFTAEEMTCYYAGATARHLPLLLAVLLDMVYGSVFPEHEVARERGVILEEINMYEDQPLQLALERLNAIMWPGQALGRPITGTRTTVSGMKRADLIDHCRRHYRFDQMHVTVAGKTTFEEVKKILVQIGLNSKKKKGRAVPPRCVDKSIEQRQPAVALKIKPIEQTHLAIGFRGVSRHDPTRYALKLASVILGENMSSRLFQSIRERYGLAYSIGSSVSFYSDSGALVISAGVETKQALKAMKLTLKVVEEMTQRPPSASELRRAKDYVIGQMWMGLESSSNQIMWMGESLLGYGRLFLPRDLEQRMQTVKSDEVQKTLIAVAKNSRLSISVVSPEGDPKDWKQIGRFP